MALLVDDLWSLIFRCSTYSIGLLVLWNYLGQAKVNDLQVAFVVYQDVFKFQISVDDTSGMQMPNSEAKLSCKEFDSRLFELLGALHYLVQLTANDEWHHEVDS